MTYEGINKAECDVCYIRAGIKMKKRACKKFHEKYPYGKLTCCDKCGHERECHKE